MALNKFEIGISGDFSKELKIRGSSIYFHPDDMEILICVSSFNQPQSTIQLGPAVINILERITSQLELKESLTKRSHYHFFIFEDKDLIGGKPLTLNELGTYTLNLPANSYRNIWVKPAENRSTILYALTNGPQIKEEFNPELKELVVTIPSKARSSAETVILGEKPKTIKMQNGNVDIIAHQGWCEGEFPCNTSIRIIY
jgi:hypothetical protein